MKESNIKLVVFDIAGTTVKDKGHVADAFIKTFKEFGFKIPEDAVYNLMGYKKNEAIKILLEQHYPGAIGSTYKIVEKLHDVFVGEMINFYETDTLLEPMPEAEYVFSQLQAMDIRVALNTGFGKNITTVILKRLGWNRTKLIDFVISSDEVQYGRPSSLMIEAVMHAMGISNAAQVAKIGDTEVDIAEGRTAGCGLVVAVTTGAYTKEQLQQYYPDVIINNLKELLPILKMAPVAKGY
jgi:phosphonatase-like hydrolase